MPDNASVVCAGNSKEESQSAYNMTEPAFRRLIHMYLPLDVQSWIEWGSEKKGDRLNIHPLISNFIATYPKNLYTEYDPENPPIDNSDKAILDPRAWEIASDIIYNNHGVLSKELLANKVGDKNAQMLIAFAKKNVITIEDILNGEYDVADIPTKADEKYAMTVSYRYATPRQVEKVRDFVGKYLGKENQSNFDYIWINNDPERAEIIEEIRNRTPEQTDEPKKIDMSQKKITIEEFCGTEEEWKSSRYALSMNQKTKCILVDTKEKYDWLCQAFDKMGRKWCDDISFKDVNYDYGFYKRNKGPMYISNNGECLTQDSVKDNQIPIYQFSDIDFSGVFERATILEIEKISKEIESYKKGKKISLNKFIDNITYGLIREDYERCPAQKAVVFDTPTEWNWFCQALNRARWKHMYGSSFSNLKYSDVAKNGERPCILNNGTDATEEYVYESLNNNQIYKFDEVDLSNYLSLEELELIQNGYDIPQLEQ